MQINLYRLRKEKSLTQKQMASKLGISEAAYRNKELDYNAFKSDEMFKIADILDTDISEIFTPSSTKTWFK